ncbi:MAB_1171c family putative transporter [Amycolatopsis anabasis]|uniref:MAB_1171c family putative transporter n=1 Tax=Amycolatopsis anabasis TaxID=1840409 RepID=UPI00131E1FF2|nr:MAB_1171c family putative transporter [Amycolatopsis anabasis]
MTGALAQQIIVWCTVTAALLYWFKSWRRAPTPGKTAMVKALAALDLVLILGVDYGYHEWLFGIPTLPNFLVHIIGLAAAYWFQVFVLYLGPDADTVPAKARARRRILLPTLAALTVLYVLGPLAAGLPEITTGASGQPFVSIYLAVFELYVGLAMFDIFWTCRKWREKRGYLRLGLLTLRWGGACGLLYAVHKALYSVAVRLDLNPPWVEYGSLGVSRLLTTCATLLLMAGMTLPAVGPRWELRRRDRALEPLWRDLTDWAPDYRFNPPEAAGKPDITDRVRNRIVEIRDVLFEPLQPYLDPAVAERARGHARRDQFDDVQAEAVAQAAVIAVALAAARRNAPVGDSGPLNFTGPGTDDYRDDATWLATVATAYTESPIVKTVLEETAPDADPVH